MSVEQLPDRETFLNASLESVARVAPATVLFGAGGTRRSAAFAGVSGESDAYARWSRQQMMRCFNLIFQHGVRHIFTPAIIPSQLREVTTGYRDRLVEWVNWGLSGEEALADYDRLGWRVRLLGTESMPELAETARRLETAMPEQRPHTLWWLLIPDLDAPWRWLLEAAHRSGARSREALIAAVYGEAVPPATLFLSFGKPVVSPALLPPLLVDQLHCYWTQRPSYELDAAQWRAILYDYAYCRMTWREDKAGRAEAALAHQDAWQRGPTLGLGVRLGPFWYPAPVAAPESKLEIGSENGWVT